MMAGDEFLRRLGTKYKKKEEPQQERNHGETTGTQCAGMNPQLLLFEHKHLSNEVRQQLRLRLQEHWTIIDGPYDSICTRKGLSLISQRCLIN